MSEFVHGNLSPWGYIIDGENIPDFLSVAEFSNFTNNKFGIADTRIPTNIKSATGSIRNYCGWHISPNLLCGMVYRVFDLRDSFAGSDLLIQLPATFVTSVEKIVINAVLNPLTQSYEGDEITEFDAEPSGLIRVYDVGCLDRKSRIFIKYRAGLPDDQISVVKELTAHRVTHAVTSSYGVMSEAAGGVSVTYNASWAGNTRSTALPDDNREVLEAYKVKGVF